MIEALSMPFMQRAIIAGVLVALLAGFYGAFVVQRGLSFLGSGLAHAAFGGVALGLLLEGEPLLVALPFTMVTALGITWIKNRTRLGPDTAVGILFSIAMALGVIFIAMRDQYSTDAFAYIFGSILSVNTADIYAAVGMLIFTLAALPLWGRWAYASFDPELALSDRLPVLRDDYVLSVLLAVTIVGAVKILGMVLITAFLIIPAASARLIAGSFFSMTLLSMLFGVVSTLLGLFAAYQLDLPSGATIILTQAAIFFVAMALPRAR